MMDNDCPSEINQRAVREAWETIGDRECFFVPCIDTKRAKRAVLAEGYTHGKNPPEARIGILRGQWGLLCYRESKLKLMKTAKPDWF